MVAHVGPLAVGRRPDPKHKGGAVGVTGLAVGRVPGRSGGPVSWVRRPGSQEGRSTVDGLDLRSL